MRHKNLSSTCFKLPDELFQACFSRFDAIRAYMWCDLGKPILWCKISNLSYWYHMKVRIILFSELFTRVISDAGIKSYWFSVVKNKEKHKNYVVNFLCSFTVCDMWRVVSDHITYQLIGYHNFNPDFSSDVT